MTRISQDAIQAFEQLKLNDKSALKPINTSSSSVAQHSHHRHHRQAMTTRPSHGDSEEESKYVSLSPASAACQMRLRFAIDEDPKLRTAAAEKERSGKKSSNTIERNSFPTNSVSCNKSSNQSSNHSFLWKQQQEKRHGGIRSKEPEKSAKRTLMRMRDDRKSSASFSLPNSNSSEANTMNLRDATLLKLQEEKPFRISAMGYDSRYEDLIYESQRCVDDDITPEQTAQAIDKCKLWLKKHHVDNCSSRANHH